MPVRLWPALGVFLLASVTAAEKAPSSYALLTLRSGHTFRVLNSGPMLDESGKRLALAISYLSSAQNPGELQAAADELFEYLRPHAEQQGDKAIAVIARLVSRGAATDHDVLYERGPSGKWKRGGRARIPFPEIPPAPQPDERDPAAQKAARAEADGWLKLIDAGKLVESWHALAPFLKQQVTQQDWIASGVEMRRSLGKPRSRSQLSLMETRTIPNGPAGHYVVVEYRSKFARRPLAFESVTEMLCDDGKWRVAGYGVR
jgi:hypothetical protein